MSDSPPDPRRGRFEALFLSHHDPVLRYLVRRCAVREDAADLLAETFLIAWRRVDDLPPGDQSLPWLYGVARRVLANHRRAESRRLSLADKLRDDLSTAAPTEPTIDPQASASPLSNWFFNIASSVLLALVITLVTRLVLSKRDDLEADADAPGDDPDALMLSARERTGLLRATIVFGIAAVAIVAVLVPHGSPLRGENGSIVESPFLDGIAMVVAVLFGLVGITYGVTVGAIEKAGDVPKLAISMTIAWTVLFLAWWALGIPLGPGAPVL